MDNRNILGSYGQNAMSTAPQYYTMSPPTNLHPCANSYQQNDPMTPPSMPDSPPHQLPLSFGEVYPANFQRAFESTPPPDAVFAAQCNLPHQASRDQECQAHRVQSGHQQSGLMVPRTCASTAPSFGSPLRREYVPELCHEDLISPALFAPRAQPKLEHINNRGSTTGGANAMQMTRAVMAPARRLPSATNHKASPHHTAAAQATAKPLGHDKTDPSMRTHYGLPKWNMPISMSKIDCDVTHGIVQSPTWMLGLPFGSTIEVANFYGKSAAE